MILIPFPSSYIHYDRITRKPVFGRDWGDAGLAHRQLGITTNSTDNRPSHPTLLSSFEAMADSKPQDLAELLRFDVLRIPWRRHRHHHNCCCCCSVLYSPISIIHAEPHFFFASQTARIYSAVEFVCMLSIDLLYGDH